jgi:hypothetical protein
MLPPNAAHTPLDAPVPRACRWVCLLFALCLAGPHVSSQAPPQTIVPNRAKRSDLTVRLDLVGRMPTKLNPTAPAVAGSELLLIDQGGHIYRWDGTRGRDVLTPASVPPGIRLAGAEGVLNGAANGAGSQVFVMFISSTVPRGIPTRTSTRDGTDAWYVLVAYNFDGVSLSLPRPITAMQVRKEGHTGGGLAVLADGSILFATGDNGDSYEDGRGSSQDVATHLSKIVRIDPSNGATRNFAVGVRSSQRLAVYGTKADARLDFIDIGGWVADELNSIRVSGSSSTIPNFGWGRHADGKAREGTLYIDRVGNSVGHTPKGESGFIDPVAEVGREGTSGFALSGPVSSQRSFSRITSLFGDLVSGSVYAITSAPSVTRQDVFRVNLLDSRLQPITVSGLTAGQRPDPRFFNFPDGSAGVLLERTGDFYRVTEVTTSK